MISKDKKSMVFIDASNLLGGWWTYCKNKGYTQLNSKTNKLELTKKIDYKNLIDNITDGTDFIRGYFYDSVDEPLDSRKQSFFDFLRSLGVTIVTKKLRHKSIECKHCKTKDVNVPYQKGVDVALVTEVMSLANEGAYEIAIIISGDNDFVDAVNYIKSKGLKVWVVSFINSLGEDTMRCADKVIQLDKIFDSIYK
ncbi:MAG TPA: NYN domain-containing protein [Candidatus Nanoarchaeia archaeon]|nr:NYN domain-containing protein [Candidatus Nanoarchaeia archaeon]